MRRCKPRVWWNMSRHTELRFVAIGIATKGGNHHCWMVPALSDLVVAMNEIPFLPESIEPVTRRFLEETHD